MAYYLRHLWGGVGATSAYSAAVTQFFARIADPGATYKAAYATFIDALVAAGVWAKADVIHVYKATDSATALTNLVQSAYAGINTGMDFTQNSGFASVAGTDNIDTQFNPTTAPSPHFTQDSASFFVWALTETVGPSLGDHANTKNSAYPRFGDGNFYLDLNASSDDPSGKAVATSIGLSGGSRVASTGYTYYKNGASVGTRTNTSAAPANATLLVAYDANTFEGSVSFCFIGGGLSGAEASALYSACAAFPVG